MGKTHRCTIVSKAPARICLFGDHQDYLNLPIIACGINRYITIKATPNPASKVFNIDKPDINERRIIRLDEDFNSFERGDHMKAALKIVSQYGCVPDTGYDIVLSGNIPINAGTSSSSAVLVSWVRFLFEAFGANVEVTRDLVAEVAYRAEVVEQGSPGGMMDQYTISFGDILFLETKTPPRYETFQKQIDGLVLAESGIPKETLGVLGSLKNNALASIKCVQDKVSDFNLDDVKVSDIERYVQYIPSELQIYFRAAIKNHDITLRALSELRKANLDIPKIGALMYEHHEVLRDDLDLTVPLIDKMIDAVMDLGAYGAKIVGSGRGGCIAAICPKGSEQQVIENLLKVGAKKAYLVEVSQGTAIVS